MPPVAKTSMPARAASATLADTVVTPTSQRLRGGDGEVALGDLARAGEDALLLVRR